MMKRTFFLEGYGSTLNASTSERKLARSLPTASVLDFITELYENSCITNLNLWCYLVTILFQSCFDLIVREKKMKALMFGGGTYPWNHAVAVQLCCKIAIIKRKTFFPMTLKPHSENKQKHC